MCTACEKGKDFCKVSLSSELVELVEYVGFNHCGLSLMLPVPKVLRYGWSLCIQNSLRFPLPVAVPLDTVPFHTAASEVPDVGIVGK
jgi:hypothetical protein